MITLSIAELEADPHTVFRHHRPLTPVIMREGLGYLVLRLQDIESLIKDPRIRSAETEYPKLRGITEGALFDNFEYGMLTSNDAVHKARRSPFTKLFAARLIAQWRPIIRDISNKLIDRWFEDTKTEVDFVKDYAALIPAYALSQILGLPQEDIPHFTASVYEVSRSFGGTFTADDIPGMEAAARDLQNYVSQLLERRRAAPGDDFLSSFLESADQRGQLSQFEMIIQVVLLIIGGIDTTRVALAVQVALLLEHHEQWNAICQDQTLIAGAVSESLRYEPSVASIPRFTLEDIDIGGEEVRAGSSIVLSTMSANRDESVFFQPDNFDIRRIDHPRLHPAFGGGAHRCIGEALARAELEESLSTLIARLPSLRMAGPPPKLKGHSGIRRIGDMRVSW